MYMTVPKQNGLKAANRGDRGTQSSTFLIGKLSPKRIMFQLILEQNLVNSTISMYTVRAYRVVSRNQFLLLILTIISNHNFISSDCCLSRFVASFLVFPDMCFFQLS